MSQTTKQILTNPESFIDNLNDCTEQILDIEFDARFEEWKARGSDKQVRASSLGTCIRQAYYSFNEQAERTPVSDPLARRRMYMGFINEEIMGKIINLMPGHTHGLDSEEQNKFPIHVDLMNDEDIHCAATTDFVKEYEDKDGGKYYIPIELKSTDVYKWKEFTYWKYDLKQLLLWVYIAKQNGLNVPYAMLVYTRRSTMDMKFCVISVDTLYSKMGKVVESYEHWFPFMDDLVNRLKWSIRNKQVPAMPTDVPQYICKTCPHLGKCMNNVD